MGSSEKSSGLQPLADGRISLLGCPQKGVNLRSSGLPTSFFTFFHLGTSAGHPAINLRFVTFFHPKIDCWADVRQKPPLGSNILHIFFDSTLQNISVRVPPVIRLAPLLGRCHLHRLEQDESVQLDSFMAGYRQCRSKDRQDDQIRDTSNMKQAPRKQVNYFIFFWIFFQRSKITWMFLINTVGP